MISNITQADFKKLTLIAILPISILFSGCTNNLKPPEPKKMSQLEWRTLQTKTFSTNNTIAVMKALIASLQDEGFIIETTNTELGLISAVKEVTETDEEDKAFQEFWVGEASGYQTSKRITASCTIATINKQTKIRINLTAKGMTESGGALWSQPIDNHKTYQNIFSKVDKSIFLQKENL
jgi:hypothetical protein